MARHRTYHASKVDVGTGQVFGTVIAEGCGTVGGSPIPQTQGVARVDGVGVDGGECLRTHREGMSFSDEKDGKAERGRRRRGSSPSCFQVYPVHLVHPPVTISAVSVKRPVHQHELPGIIVDERRFTPMSSYSPLNPTLSSLAASTSRGGSPSSWSVSFMSTGRWRGS
jgi:hypothetical protein